MIKQALRRFITEQAYHPSWAGVFVNPFFIARRGLACAVAEAAPNLRGRLLDVGCGSKPYRRYFDVDEYVGLDIDTQRTRAEGSADLYYDGGRFPVPDASFDVVLCNQVLEHVFNPEVFLAELFRVLKPGGRLLLTAPFVWDEHEQPHDFARYSSFGLAALLERAGFHIDEHHKLGADASMLFQLINAYLFKVLPANYILRLFACAVVMAPLSLVGVGLGWLLPGNPDLFLDHLVVAQKQNS